MRAATIADTGINAPVLGAAKRSANPPTVTAVANPMTVTAHSGKFVRSILRRPLRSTRRSYVAVNGRRPPDWAIFVAPISGRRLVATSGSPPTVDVINPLIGANRGDTAGRE
jgi:hypothetical protein